MKSSERIGCWNEVKVTWALCEVMPEEFQKPIAVEFDLGWMLTRNYGTTLPYRHFEDDFDVAKQVLCHWAEIQKKSVAKVQELQKMGVAKVDGKAMKAGVNRVMEDPAWFKAQREEMDEEQLEQYYDEREYKSKYRKYLERLFEKVEGYRVPLALVNGDLESVNTIIGENQKCTFIDMFHTQISFPFMDVVSFPIKCGSGLSLHDFDLDFYLEYWTEYETMERLRELLSLVDEVRESGGTPTRVLLQRDEGPGLSQV
ncbi:Protein kinase-like protein [Gracilaria domingensis]|nr:Protein kinase-like protein [Gracilaria domingensis]